MRTVRWMVAAALAGAFALGACTDQQGGGNTEEEDQTGGVPVGAIPAPEATPANPAAAGVPLDSAAPADSVSPQLGR